MYVPFEVIIHILWLFFRGIYICFQKVSWVITGTSRRIDRNHDVESHGGTAQILDVLFRHKIDLLAQPSGLNNFILRHRKFKDPEYVLAPNVTLYAMNDKDAIFVETDHEVDVTKSECSPFMRVAQFQHARRLVLLPMHAFHDLAERVGRPSGKLIVVSMTARCGSTLLTQVFEETGRSITLSEPDAVYTVLACRAKEQIREDQMEKLVVHTVNMLCKSRDTNIASYIIKLPLPSMPLVPLIAKLFPDATQMFMYRNGLKMSNSMVKSLQQMPLVVLLMRLARMVPRIIKMMAVRMKIPNFEEHYDMMIQSYMHLACASWAIGIRQYIDYRNDGVDIVGVRYEDMLSDKYRAMKAIFGVSGLLFDKEAVDRAYSRDAQRGSPLSRDNLKSKATQDYTCELAHEMDVICDKFQVPRLDSPCLLPGTITLQIADFYTEYSPIKQHEHLISFL